VTTARRLTALSSALLLAPLVAVAAVTTSATSATADSVGGLFEPLAGFRQTTSDDARVRPTAYRAFRADLDGIRAELAGGGTRTITVPAPTGETPEFTVAEDSVMEPELQAAHPELRTYAGHGPAGSTIRLDVTPMGFHAMVRNADGVTWYVDPAQNRVGEERVLSYLGAAVPRAEQDFVEHGLERTGRAALRGTEGFAPTPGGAVSSRSFRLAFVTDSSYAAQFGNTDGTVFAEKTSLINRVNEVYNDDLAVKFVMVGGTDTLLNLAGSEATATNGACGANACYTSSQLAGCGGALLDRNEFVLGMLIGAENFDIGHIGLGKTGGGIAGLGVVGGRYKADGCTGVPAPTTGDFYAIDYVAHEMGHQMGGDHTFNGTQSNCATGNRNSDPYTTQVEPGSGSSIMAYAGICQTDNLQPHSDPYFSFATVDQVNAVTAATPTSEDEQQVVSFSGLAAGETFTLSCSGCGISSAIGITGNPVTDRGTIAAAVTAATGLTVLPTQVSGYDGALSPSLAGFTVDFDLFGSGSGTDVKTLTVQVATGTFTSIVGTIYNGGPTTNQGLVTATANSSPVVSVPATKTIPTRTPFTLTGSATDPNSDGLTYMWEQTDPGGLSGTDLVSNTKTNGPLFRQFGVAATVTTPNSHLYDSPGENLAGTDPSRTFPDLAQILANNTNAATGSCPAAGANPVAPAIIDCYSEFLPTSAWVGNPTSPRVLHFRLTARDRFTGPAAPGTVPPGGLSSADTSLTVSQSAGPFLVTSRATAGSPASGFENVTWDVAGTNTAAMATEVRISLSTDGGLTFPTVLAASTANDGAEVVTMPNITTSTARIKIEAVGNYFFDINGADFSIAPVAGNLTPLVDAGPDASVAVSTPLTSSGSFADESPGTATATVDYGDGSGPQTLPLAGSTFTLNHTYTSAGAKTVTVAVTDGGMLTGTDTATVTVTAADLPPTVSAGPDKTVAVNTPFTSSGSFTDESPGTATATVNYGDGAGEQVLTLAGSTFTLNHTYTSPGARTVTVKVTDSAMQSGTDTASVTVNAGPTTPPAASTVQASAMPRKVVMGHRFKVEATVSTGSGVPTGVVEIYDGSKLLGTGTLANGTVTIKVSKKKAKKLKVGKHTLTAKYVGTATVSASQVDFVVKVKRRT